MKIIVKIYDDSFEGKKVQAKEYCEMLWLEIRKVFNAAVEVETTTETRGPRVVVEDNIIDVGNPMLVDVTERIVALVEKVDEKLFQLLQYD